MIGSYEVFMNMGNLIKYRCKSSIPMWRIYTRIRIPFVFEPVINF